VTDFVTPNWFGHKDARGPVDQTGRAQSAFQLLSGGYAQKWDPQAGWQQVTGALAMRFPRIANAPKGSRRERRARQWKHWKRSEHRFGR
jgi:hypothetical protein